MARQPRFNLPGYPQHVIVRGNNREPIFYSDGDYTYYLQKLQKAIDIHCCELHAYVLMTNHVHLLITPLQDQSLSKAIQSVGRGYVQQFNRLYGRTGTLWEGRYKATIVDSERYALACYRYIELNPVRAGMIEHPAEYPWSSYRCNALGSPNELLTPHGLYESLGETADRRHENYCALFEREIPTKMVSEIRDMTNKSWALGCESFKVKIQAQLERPIVPREKGGDRKSAGYKADLNINRV